MEPLGAYKLIERIGAGGMGEVWKAEDTRLGRIVAIKIVAPEVASDPESIARLRREARTAAQLNHPNIATIHSIEEAAGRLFVVMEYVEGEPLSSLIKRGRIPEAELCRIGRNVADALAEAHAKGIIHRDIKPDNIIVAGPKVKVLDFGIAKQIGVAGSSSDAPTATFMTQQGMIVGTIHYMSPEQALGKPLDPRTDIFSLGVVLYEAATGQLPFRGETVTDTMTQIIRDEPQEPVRINPKVSAGLNAVIRRCMRKNRDERFANAAALARALEAPTVLTGSLLQTVREPVAKKSRRGWIAAAVAILLIGTVAVAIWYHDGSTRAVPPPPAAAPKPAQTRIEVSSAAPVPAPPQQPSNPATQPPRQQPSNPATQQPSRTPTAHDYVQRGHRALLNHNFPKAIEEYQMALDRYGDLEERERALSHLGIAIAMHNRLQAERLGREIARRWPGDPDFERIRAAFGGMSGPMERPARRWPRP